MVEISYPKVETGNFWSLKAKDVSMDWVAVRLSFLLACFVRQVLSREDGMRD